MSFVTIYPEKCVRDGLCVQACPVDIFRQHPGEIPTVVADTSRCILCGHCVSVCPKGALIHSLMPMEDFRPVPELPDAGTVEQLLVARRSVRAFRREPIPLQTIETMVETARRAPTASNSQKIDLIVINGPSRLDDIRALTMDWMASDPKRVHHVEAAARGRDVVLRGGTTLVVAHCPQDYLFADTDSAIALTYLELLATSMKFGACWGGLITIASRNNTALLQTLGVPEHHKVGGAMMLGLPTQKHYLVPPRDKARVTWL